MAILPSLGLTLEPAGDGDGDGDGDGQGQVHHPHLVATKISTPKDTELETFIFGKCRTHQSPPSGEKVSPVGKLHLDLLDRA